SKSPLLSVSCFVQRLPQPSRHGGIDDAWFDDCYPDAKCLHLLGQCFAQRLQGEFGRCVGGKWGTGDVSGDRGDVDDASTLALAHLWDERLDATYRPEVVGLHDRAEFAEGKFFDGPVALHSSVVDQ